MSIYRLELKQRQQELLGDENLLVLQSWERLKAGPGRPGQRSSLRRFLFQEELEAYKRLRGQSKAAKLLQTVFRSITSEHSVCVLQGQAEFFEFVLKNTFAEPVNCSVELSGAGLQLVTDREEWALHKRLHQLRTPLEPGLVGRAEDGKQFIYLKALESVHVPFKLDLFGRAHEQSAETPPFEAKVSAQV